MKMKNKLAERGVAILFSLGILGMMTVLALTFASISMTNQTIAKNTSNQLSAKEMAKSIVDRVKFILSNSGYSTGVINNPTLLQNFYSEDSTKHFDWIWKLGMTGTDIESALYRTDGICDYSSGKKNQPTWQYIKDSNDKIVGRFAYVVRATDLPLINLNSVLFDENNKKIDTQTRLGFALYELDPGEIYKAASKSNTIPGAYTNFIANVKNSQKRLNNFNEFEQYRTDVSLDLSKVIAKTYTSTSVRYPEIFRLNNTTAAYRFDVSQMKNMSVSDRKTLVDKITGTGGVCSLSSTDTTEIPWFKNFDDTELGEFTNAAHKAKQIAANFVDFFSEGYKPTSDQPGNVNWVTGTAPTYIGLKKTPAIYGAGGIIQLGIQHTPTEIKDGEGTVTGYQHKLDVYATISALRFELCNFDPLPIGSNIRIRYTGTCTLTYNITSDNEDTKNDQTITITLTNTNGGTASIPDPTEPKAQKIEPKIWVRGITNDGTTAANANITMNDSGSSKKNPKYTVTVTNATFTLKASLEYKEGSDSYVNVDFAQFSVAPSATGTIGFETSDDTLQDKNYFGIAARVFDPRHNQFSSEWKTYKLRKDEFDGLSKYESYKAAIYAGFLNNNFPETNDDPLAKNKYGVIEHTFSFFGFSFKYYTGQDVKDITVPDGVYLRQGAPKTPWEFCMIHRGAPWQTLNLKTIREDNPLKGGTWAQGDAGLLDQLRMSSDAAPYGKIPLNEIWGEEQSNIIFDILQRNARHTSPEKATVDDSAGNSGLRNTNLGLVNFFNTRKGNSSKPYFEYRYELAKILTYSSEYHILASEPSSDAAKAELFTKCVMLFDVEPTYLPRRVYVFGIAQTIQDVNGSVAKAWNNNGNFSNNSSNNAGASDIGKFNAGYRTASGIDVAGATYPNSGLLSSTFGNYVNGVDKILSEQKVFAVLEREYTVHPYSSSNKPKWKIVRFEYVQ